MRGMEKVVEEAVGSGAAALAAGLRAALPGVRVECDGGDVRLSGRGLAKRVLDEPSLRDPSSVAGLRPLGSVVR